MIIPRKDTKDFLRNIIDDKSEISELSRKYSIKILVTKDTLNIKELYIFNEYNQLQRSNFLKCHRWLRSFRMTTNRMSSSDVNNYKEEIEQLQSSLKEALREKYEAAQYGLRLLEEKDSLQAKLDENEEVLAQLKRELQLTQEVTEFVF